MYAQPRTLRGAKQPFPDPLVALFDSCDRSHISLVLLLDRLTLLAQDLFVRIANAFPFVRLRRIVRSDVSGDLPYFLAVNSFNQNFGILLDGNLNTVRNLEYDRVGKTQA